jgi:iron(III) transport system substrate-binding protein
LGKPSAGKPIELQVPANKTFKLDPRIPAIDNMRLIKYDFEKYGKAAECRRLIDRWQKEVESLPR